MRGDDLAPLLAGGERSDLGFHTGTVVAWEGGTGANTIDVAGATMTDLPILNTSDTVMLEPGHVVGLIRFKTTYFILGRVTPPGTDQFATAAVHLEESGVSAWQFTLGTDFASKVSTSLQGPAWANEALLSAQSVGSAWNDTGAQVQLGHRIMIDGANGTTYVNDVRNNSTGQSTAIISELMSGPVGTFHDQPIQLDAEMAATTALASNASNQVTLHATVTFRRNEGLL